ncbi:MAG: manganese efflux pump MntP family protein [Clostridium sp.]|jgi:putative Mn2+ efflux pump MntP|nr:manganese efflux pump MntP family protein [Clostridium sp.]
MGIIELLLIAVALSMDAFAAAIGKGIAWRQWTLKKALTVGLWFGVFQAAMPLAGYYAGTLFASKIDAFDHWIAFGLLAFIGGKMLVEGIKKHGSCEMAKETPLGVRELLPLAVATSIDALAAGAAFSMNEVNILPAVALIGVITCAFSAAGTKIGQLFGCKYQSAAEIIGGAVLIFIGTKTLLEHLGVI